MPRPLAAAGLDVLVIQPSDMDFGRSPSTTLRAQGASCEQSDRLDAPPTFAPGRTDALVVDIQTRTGAALDAIDRWLKGGLLGGRPVIVVGPDDDMGAMTGALSIGAADYVPESDLAKLPKKLVRAMRRKKKG